MIPVDGETAALLVRLGAMQEELIRSPRFGDIDVSRAFAASVFGAFAGPVDPAAVTCRTLALPGGAGLRPARCYRPAEAGDAALPVVLFLHGGGWVQGDLDCYDELVRALTALSGVAFLSLDYRLAPEHPFPAGLEDALAALRWLGAQGATLGLDPAAIALMGDSAGGNLAAAVCNLARDGDLPAIAAQFLIYPVIDPGVPHETYASRTAFGDGRFLLANAAIDATRDWYLAPGDDAGDPRVTPLNARDFAGLPPTHVMVAGLDPLRDEGRAYYERLRDAGVPASFDCYDGAIHAFLSFGMLRIARAARARIAERVRYALVTRGAQTP